MISTKRVGTAVVLAAMVTIGTLAAVQAAQAGGYLNYRGLSAGSCNGGGISYYFNESDGQSSSAGCGGSARFLRTSFLTDDLNSYVSSSWHTYNIRYKWNTQDLIHVASTHRLMHGTYDSGLVRTSAP